MLTRPTEAVRRSGYWLVLALIALSYVLCAAQERPNPNPIAFLAQLATVAVALWIAEVSPVALRVSLAIVGVAVIAVLGAEIAGLEGHAVDIALSAASALACFIAPTAIIAHQVRLRRPGIQNLIAAVAAYVLVGMLFTFVYNLAALLTPVAILDGPNGDSLRGQLFFSFTTLTTTGYGNVVPVGPVMETFAVVEAIAGQLFLVIAVASMVIARNARGADASAEVSQG